MRRHAYSVFAISTMAVLIGLFSATRAEAHGLGAECKLVGNKVEVEAFYDDDTAARDAKVKVEDQAKKVVVEGRTDKAGRWSFARPQPGRYVVMVDAGAGHRTQVKITIPQEAGALVSASGSSPDADCECCDETKCKPGANEPPTISDGPSRSEFTSFPWVNTAIGVSVLGALAIGFFVSRRLK